MTAAKSAWDPTRRRRALEEALRVTEDQLGSVREKGRQLGRLQRQLVGQVRELRRLLSPSRAAYIPEKLAGRT